MTRSIRLFLPLVLALGLLTGTVGNVSAYTIGAVRIDQTADDFALLVEGDAPPTYTMYELFDPLRLVIDIADAMLAESAQLPTNVPQGPVLEVNASTLSGQDPPITRIEVTLAEDRGYSVERRGNNIMVSFAKEEVGSALGEVPIAEASQPVHSNNVATQVLGIEVDTSTAGHTRVLVKTDGPISHYKKAHLPKSDSRPFRMYIDLPGLAFPGQMWQQRVGSAVARVRAAQRENAVRIVFDGNDDKLFDYTITKEPDGLMVDIVDDTAQALLAGLMEPPQAEGLEPLPAATEPEEPGAGPASPPAAGQELIKPILPPLSSPLAQPKTPPKQVAKPAAEHGGKESPGKEKTAGDIFSFAGYDRQKISVDFFKIDLHNVFRLFGEISGQNIVVDEAVKGSLTLALNDVPWDFALDIILNLKDLQKEERYNTIVISPKAKQFVWPKTATDKIAFKADGTMEKMESISIKQRIETPKEVLEAKKLIREASRLDRDGDYAGALALYEKALSLWPDNGQLASRMASLCLVHLGQNAKAVHYAKKALAADPADSNAALQAAIALANMKKVPEAKLYFDRAVAAEMPPAEALLSYAAFAEEYKSYNGALALLKRHEQLYGDTLDTLVAKARIYDKLGDTGQAVEAYRTILLSGYALPPDLKQYITARIAASENM